MRAVVQRVKGASVEVDGEVVSRIGPGLLCLVGLRDGDTERDAEYIAKKILGLRLWPSPDGSRAWVDNVVQRGYEVLCVSQFTLYGRLKGAGKPDYSKAMPPGQAREAYAAFMDRMRAGYQAERVQDGVFGAMMQVALVNDGPVTFTLDSENPNNLGSSASIAGSLSSVDAA